MIKIEKQLKTHLLVYCSAIKPGQRFTDETSTLNITENNGVRFTGQKDLQLFQEVSKVAKAEKEINKDITFKVELSDKDKSNPNRLASTIYHTNMNDDWAAP